MRRMAEEAVALRCSGKGHDGAEIPTARQPRRADIATCLDAEDFWNFAGQRFELGFDLRQPIRIEVFDKPVDDDMAESGGHAAPPSAPTRVRCAGSGMLSQTR